MRVVTIMFAKVFAAMPDGTELTFHSHQGRQYQHKRYQRILKAKDIRQSIRRKGNCLDNTVAESFCAY